MHITDRQDSRRRSLWIFNHYAGPRDSALGTRHFDIAQELVGAGHTVTIFAASVNHLSQREERLHGSQLYRDEMIAGVRFVWIRTPTYKGNSTARIANMFAYSAGAMVAQAHYSAPDYIVGSSPHPFAALAALGTAVVRRRPFFFEIRDLWPQTMIDIGAMSPQSGRVKLMRGLERLLYRRSTRVISLLEGVPDYAREHGLDPQKVVHIPNGIVLGDHGSISSEAQLTAFRQFRETHPFVAIYIGTFGLANNVSIIADAAQLLADRGRLDVGIVLIGDGPDRDNVADRIAQLRPSNIQLLERIPKREVSAFLDIADAAIVHFRKSAVHRYGISFNKLYDYLGSSRPVLFACATPYDPVERIGAGISIPPDSPSSMADGLARLADMSPESRGAMGRRGYEYVRRRHDISSLATELLDALTRTGDRPDSIGD